MTHDEYEQRKRHLEEELRAGVALLETAFRHQLRALQLVWAATGGGDVEIPPPVVALPAARNPLPTAPPVLPAPPVTPPQPARRRSWELFDDVVTALAGIPDVFDRNDICRAIGYEPDRGSLYRTFQELIGEGAIAIDLRGTGKLPTRYKKTGASTTPAAA